VRHDWFQHTWARAEIPFGSTLLKACLTRKALIAPHRSTLAPVYAKFPCDLVRGVRFTSSFTPSVDKAVALFSGSLNVKEINDCAGLTLFAGSFLRQLFYNLIDNSIKHGSIGDWDCPVISYQSGSSVLCSDRDSQEIVNWLKPVKNALTTKASVTA